MKNKTNLKTAFVINKHAISLYLIKISKCCLLHLQLLSNNDILSRMVKHLEELIKVQRNTGARGGVVVKTLH
jgi:hypothetical protein